MLACVTKCIQDWFYLLINAAEEGEKLQTSQDTVRMGSLPWFPANPIAFSYGSLWFPMDAKRRPRKLPPHGAHPLHSHAKSLAWNGHQLGGRFAAKALPGINLERQKWFSLPEPSNLIPLEVTVVPTSWWWFTVVLTSWFLLLVRYSPQASATHPFPELAQQHWSSSGFEERWPHHLPEMMAEQPCHLLLEFINYPVLKMHWCMI